MCVYIIKYVFLFVNKSVGNFLLLFNEGWGKTFNRAALSSYSTNNMQHCFDSIGLALHEVKTALLKYLSNN